MHTISTRNILASLSGAALILSLFGCIFGEVPGDEPGDDPALCDTVAPTCPDNTVQVSKCGPNESCVEVQGGCDIVLLCREEVVNCLAIPTCDATQKEVPSCSPGATCETSTLCGTTIICEDIVPCAAGIGCSDGYQLVDSCDPALDSCNEYMACGSTYYCQEFLNTCQAYPTCPEGSTELPQNQTCGINSECFDETLCSYTITCEVDAAACLAVPACRQGYTEVSECPQDTSCERVITCGQTILCAQTDDCSFSTPALECEDGYVEVSECPHDGPDCTSTTVCGQTLHCLLDIPVSCQAYPTCPEGSTELPQNQTCGINSECFDETLCSYTITCEVDPADCRAIPTCQPGFDEVESCLPGLPCERVITCGQTILCQESLNQCQAYPTCPEGSTELPQNQTCGINSECFDESLCGYTITCEVDEAFCFALPSCPEGSGEVPACTQNADCTRVITCGQTILCEVGAM